MWIGDVFTLKQCALLSKQETERVLQFFQENDLQKLSVGKYPLNGNNFVNVFEYETKENNGTYEAHRKYLDIHCVIDGTELVSYADQFYKITKDYDEKDDYYLGIVKREENIPLTKSKLIVFGVNEPHKASILRKTPSFVKKAVIKIEVAENVRDRNN